MSPIKAIRVILAAIQCLILMGCVVMQGSASAQTGSLQVILERDGLRIGQGSAAVYRVAEERDGVYYLTEEFAPSGVEITQLHCPETAARLAAYARWAPISGKYAPFSEEGIAQWETLELGVYLVVQQQPAEGYLPFSPFLVQIPTEDYIWDMTANPKVYPETDPEESEPQLPQTGQNNRPVFILMSAGCLLLALGLIINRKYREKE